MCARRALVLCLALFLLLSISAFAAKPRQTVTSTVGTPDTSDSVDKSGAPIILSDASNPSGAGSHVYVHGASGVTSYLQNGSEWELGTLESASRTFWLDLGALSAVGTGSYVRGRFVTHCFTPGAVPVGKLTRVGESTVCPATFRFEPEPGASTYYRIGFNSSVRPGTGDLRFTCDKVSETSACIAWTVTPADNDSKPGDGRSTGRLLKVTEARAKATETFVADYDVVFEITITRP